MTILSPGFASPIEAQSSFRAILRAFSRPGDIQRIGANLTPPALSFGAAAALLTLTDQTTGVYVENEAAREWLLFHTGARLTGAGEADFVVCAAVPDIAALRAGTDAEPETGATVILDVPSFAGPVCRLMGPGIETETILRLPLTTAFLASWSAQRAGFPRGVDLLICAGSEIIGLPRGTDIQEEALF